MHNRTVEFWGNPDTYAHDLDKLLSQHRCRYISSLNFQNCLLKYLPQAKKGVNMNAEGYEGRYRKVQR